MEFFDKVAEGFTEGADKVAKVAKEVSSIATLKFQIERAEYNNEKLYAEIGKLLYESHKFEIKERLPEISDKLEESVANIEKWKEQLFKAKNVNACPSCGRKNDKGAKFCSECGTKLPEVKAEEPVKDEAPTAEAPVNDCQDNNGDC